MRKASRTLAAAFMAAIVLAGCQNEDPMNKVKEGLPVSLSFNMEVPEMDEITVTRATEEQETKVEKMAILFYNANQPNSTPIIVKVRNLGEPTRRNSNTNTNWLYTIELNEDQLTVGDRKVTSGEWYMYPIANYDKYTVVNLDELAGKTLAEFRSHTITASGRDITSTSVLMSGHYGDKENTTTITLQPGENTFDKVFHLKRIVSKNVFVLKSGTGVTFIPKNYSIYNYSTSSTLLQRDELNEYAGDDTFTKFEDLPIAAPAAGGDYSFSFYMPENVQKPAASPTSWSYADRERRESDYSTFTYAPAKSTYVVIEGTYEGPGESGTDHVTGTVKYTIHLGDFGNSTDASNTKFGNFSVTRNARYTYTITVNGVKNIIAEAKKVSDNQPGAEGQIIKPSPHVIVNLDAHFENVLLTFSKTNIDQCIVSGTVPAGEGKMTSFTVQGGSTDPHLEDIAWVKFGKPASQTAFANYPGDANLVNIYNLIDEIKAGNTTHCIISGDNVYTQAYVDEYFYNDKPYKDFVNMDDRILSFTIGNAQISADGHSTYIEGSGFTLKQKSIKTFYKDNVGNPFGFESVEETPAATFTGNDDYPGTELQNGLKNTWEIINTKTTKTWTDYVNIAQNGFTGATPPTSANIMTTDGTNPMFECLSRNRDLNGDGKIDEDEVRWYLPSVRQCIFAWCGKESLPTEISFETTNYATSTNLGFRIWWALEGTAISSWDNKETNPMIRCVRNLGTNSTSGEVSDITSWDQENYVVTVNGLKDETLRTNTQIGEYPEHENFDAASTLPKAFKIASADLNIPASGDSYVPIIKVGDLSYSNNSSSQEKTITVTIPITIENYDKTKTHTYQIGNETGISLDDKLDATNTANIDVSVAITYNGDFISGYTGSGNASISVKADNGNYNRFSVNVNASGGGILNNSYTYTAKATEPTPNTVTGGTSAKNTFKYTEIMNGDWCEKYYQEGTDDLGKWRIPNEKELYFIQKYFGEEITGNLAGYKPSETGAETGTMRYAAKTKYNRNQEFDSSNPGNTFMIYYLQKDGEAGTPIVTTGHGQSGADFTIRCVRDAPQGTRSYDSSYSSGGTGFGL